MRFILFVVISFIVRAQELHQVYVINHKTTANYHAFSRVDRASLIEAIEKMGMVAFPCGIDLLATKIDINSIVFHFQLYRACSLIDLQPKEDLTSLLTSRVKEKTRNRAEVNFDELAKALQNASDNTRGVTFMNGSGVRGKIWNADNNLPRQIVKDLKSLHINFTRPIRRRRSYSSTRSYLASINEGEYEESEEDLDYYSQMTIDDIKTEASILKDTLISSRFANEGCISTRLEPVDTIRGLRPFGGDSYILNEVLKEILGISKNKSPDHYLINISYRPTKCYTLCTTIVPLTPSPSSCGGFEINNFEASSKNELWTFINSEQIEDSLAASKHAHLTSTRYIPPTRIPNKEDNFRIVVGSGQNSSNHYAYFSSREPRTIVPMIVSNYFQHTSGGCELMFRHRIHGITGSELIVTTEHLEHRALLGNDIEEDDEADDWVRPTIMALFKPIRDDHEQWTQSNVSIGKFEYPTRIRIECHTAQQQRDPSLLNVECNVDDIDLVNCDEVIWKADVCMSTKQSNKYLCHRKGPQRCIDYSDVCDFHPECEDEEDEDNAIHKCLSVPPGARCDFELSTDTGCLHWKLFSPNTAVKNGSRYLQRVSLSDARRISTHGLPPADIFYHGNKRAAGHFLLFSTYGLSSDQSSNGEVLYNYAVSPAFPPTSIDKTDSDPVNYRTCMARFFYCHTGTSTFQMMLENGADFSHKEVLWTPPKTTGREPCEWQKASVSIPHQDAEYRLKIAFGKLYKQPSSVAIDDFSMTPSCFLELNSWSARFVPDKLQIEACSTETNDCKDPSVNEAEITIANDKRSWLVPSTGLYHIQLFGASGGQLPGQTSNNLGGVVAANLKLQRNQELSFIVGKSGLNPCVDKLKTLANTQTKSNLERIWRIICAENTAPSSADLEFARRDIQNLFGSSGGGATAVYLDNNLVGVAGAGGGLFPEVFILPSDNKSDPTGGEFSEANKVTPKPFFANWAAGNGASFGLQQQINMPANCADCGQMSGRSITIKDKQIFLGGQCPKSRHYNITGGFGGGGASCGSGAGGGAGYHPGNAGHKSHAEGGTSAFLIKNAQVEWIKGSNMGDGKILIVRCSLKCPTNSTCSFEKPIPNTESRQFCQCNNGKKTYENGTCSSFDLFSVIYRVGSAIAEAINIEPSIGILILVILVLILFTIPICVCYMLMRLRYGFCQNSPFIRRVKFWLFPNKPNDEFEMNSRVGSSSVMERSRSTIGGNLIKENPIYERLVMIELPHISRHFIQLKRSIGHGAFGEVFEGYFNLNDSITRVAVKTLPIDSNPESDCDFETEARLLNQFNHPNIVRFYGVSFEQQPKYIILEYLEGGDMRNFLRECRPKPNAPLDEPQPISMIDLIHMALDVAHGCAYLENSKFIHRDIAARNILLTTKGPNRTAKIADFGMARDIFNSEYYRKGGRAFLAVKWLPPEGFLDGIFNSKTDVWSFGVLLWEIFTLGYMPYTLKQNQEVMQLVVAGGRLEYSNGVPEEIYDEMLRCWNTDPEERPNFYQIVDFFTNLATDPRMMDLPVPPILHRQSQLTPSSTRSSIPPLNEDIVTSQATMSTALASSMTESSTNSSVSMPTQGEGVNHNVFPPYQSRFSRPLMDIRQYPQLIRDSSLSSHDDSTLHDTCSVKQSPYRIDKDALKNMQLQNANRIINSSSQEMVPFIPTPPPKPNKIDTSDQDVTNKDQDQSSPLV